MSDASTIVSSAPSRVTLQETQPVGVRRRARSRFYVGMSATLLLIVIVGFARTLYLRPLFDVPAVSVSLLVHGCVLTAWFVFVLLQSVLVTAHRTDLHRRLGWVGVGLGMTAVVLSAAEVVMFVSRTVARRRQPAVHRRLMLLAAITLIQPAMARVRQIWFPEMDGPLFAIVWLSLLVGAIAVHDLWTTKRVHPATVLAGAFFLGSRALAQYLVAPSDFGVSVVRGFVE